MADTTASGLSRMSLPAHCSLEQPPAEIARAAARLRETSNLERDLTRQLADLDQKLLQTNRSIVRARQLALALNAAR